MGSTHSSNQTAVVSSTMLWPRLHSFGTETEADYRAPFFSGAKNSPFCCFWKWQGMAPVKRFRTASFAVKVCMPGKTRTKKIALRVQRNFRSICAEKEENSQDNEGHDDFAGTSRQITPDTHDNNSEPGREDGHDEIKNLNEYERRLLREEGAWEKMRSKLRSSHVKQQYLSEDFPCRECTQEGRAIPKAAVYRCQDCGPGQFYCHDCATSLHGTRNFFHILEVWRVSILQYIDNPGINNLSL